MKKRLTNVFKKATAGLLTAAMCVTSLSTDGLMIVNAAMPADREDTSIVYFVDCGDYIISTVSEGDQLGTHNSVTDQAYGEDAVTGYQWGIVDTEEELTGNGSLTNPSAPENGGVYTANTWAFEQNTANTDVAKTESNRYSKNFYEKGIEERYVDYAFELEAGTYEVTVGCTNPWNCSNSPVVKADLETAEQSIVLSQEGFTVPNGGSQEASGNVVVPEGGDKLTIDVRGTGEANLCVNVGYILIKSIKADETEDEKAVRKDKEALTLTDTTKVDLALPAQGDNGSSITWTSDHEDVITKDGKVTRPEAGQEDAVVTMTATITSGNVSDTKEFQVTVPAMKAPAPVEREDNYVVYFVDCGDYVVDTVSNGDQLGTHNSVTDQVYGEDAVTGYKWGIVDTEEELTGKNVTNPTAPKNGGVYTANTWAYEQNTANKDVAKTESNRYTKNFYEKGIAERYLDYKFELENGLYDVTVCCTDPWGCSKTPNVYLNYGKDDQMTMKEGLDASAKEVVKKTFEVTDGELTVNVKATGDDNKAINLAYILIRKYKELTPEEMEAEAKKRVNNDYAALTLESTDITSDLDLITEGANETTITWSSSNEAVISNTGKVTRPSAGNSDVPVTLTATVSYNDYSMTKKFSVKVLAESDLTDLQEFSLADVEITDDYYNTVTEKDVAFLNKFDPDRLLYNFRFTAGYTAAEIKDGRFDFNKDGVYASSPYPGGWENSRIGGHTMGHYLAAMAQAVADGYGEEKGEDGYTINQRLEYLIDGLKDCQDKLGTGYIFGATLASQSDPERQFDTLEKGSTTDTWVPWYTMHKIINGLVETYKLTGNETALTVAEGLGEWTYNRTNKWTTTIQYRVLGVEYGGMNDCLYELYKCARDTGYAQASHFAEAAHWFDEEDLFDRVLAGEKNLLNGRHANCTIPKFMGALNRYRALKDEENVDRYLQYAESFWTLITEKHTYITGGNSECEFFGADNVLDAERSHCNCETCNTHNMLKLTRELYRITGDKKYADYYENTFINAIMASVNEETGMTTYFQPMATGFFKVYCNPDLEKNYFWCCTGTGLENFTKLGDSFYYYTDDKLIVNQYTSSNVTWKEKDVILKQETDIPNTDKTKFTVALVNGKTSAAFDLRLRIPDWLMGTATVKVNGTTQNVTASNGYIALNRTWKDGDTVELILPMGIQTYTLPDNAGTVYGFKYGPVVLAAELGTDDKMDTYQVGVQCDVCKTKIVNGEERTSTNGYGSTSNQGTLNSETLNVDGVSVAEYMENIEDYLVKDANSLTFTLQGTDWGGSEPLKFTPYYRINDQRYGIYWLFAGADPAAIQERILNAKKAGRDTNVNLEGIGVGYGTQTEGNEERYPHIQETGNGSTGNMGNLTRYANAGGAFSYLFKIDKNKTNYLNCQYSPEDNGKTMIIKVGDVVIAEDKLNYDGTEDTYTVQYEIPASVLNQAVSYDKKDETTGTTATQDVIRIAFSGAEGEESPRIWTTVYTSTNYDNNPGIAGFTSSTGTVTKVDTSNYRLEVPADTSQIQLKTELVNKYGLLYMDGVLVDDTKAKKFTLNEKETVVAIKVYAEDHVTTADYQLTIVKKDEGNASQTVAVKSITVTPTAKSLAVGETVQLNVTVSPENAANKSVTYQSQDTSIAAVDASGKVTAKKAGTTTITVTSKENSSITAKCKITVNKPSITISGASEVTKGKSIKLTASLKNIKGTVKWSMDSTKYATLKANGTTAILTAKKKAGTVKVTAQIGTVKATKTIKVVTPVKSLKLNKKSKTLSVGQTFKLKATVSPSNATNKKVTFKSSNPKVVKVTKSGKVTAKKKGTATITVTSKSNKKVKVKCKIKVKKPSITISGNSTVKQGKSIKLTAKLKNVVGKAKWSVSNKKLASIKGSGKTATLKAKKAGTVKVTVTVSGVKKTKTIKITK